MLTILEYTYTCIYNVQTSLYNHISYLKVCKKVDLCNFPRATDFECMEWTQGSIGQRKIARPRPVFGLVLSQSVMLMTCCCFLLTVGDNFKIMAIESIVIVTSFGLPTSL